MKRVYDGETENACPSRGGLGDLMADPEHGFWGSSGSASGFSPLERVLLSANGNLQRLVSSYLNMPVTVTVHHNTKKSHGVYEREVVLSAHGQQFGVATSTVTLTREDCIDAVEKRGVAIGQMFRHLNIMPRFTLHRFGEQADGRFWREYTLEGKGVSCKITEQLTRGIFELAAAPPAAPPEAAPAAAAAAPAPAAAAPPPAVTTGSFGDIMSVNTTGIALPEGFTPKQRLLLTANGNVERIVRAYYDEEARACAASAAASARSAPLCTAGAAVGSAYPASPPPPAGSARPAAAAPPAPPGPSPLQVVMHVLENSRKAAGVYERKVVMHVRGEEIMQARSMVFVTDEAWLDATERQRVGVSELFNHMGVLPTFTLHSAGRCPDSAEASHFWRVYSMRASGMACEITETYRADVLDRPPKGKRPSLFDHNGF